MKHSILIVILILIDLSCFGQTNDDNSFFENSYSRKVIKENKIDSIAITIVFPDNQTKRLFSFDTLGNLTHIITRDETGNKTSESFLRYNKKGQLTSRRDIEEMVDDNTSYTYNKNGQLDKIVTIDKDRKAIITTYAYERQKLIEETRKESSGKLVSKYKYDTQGRLKDFTTLTFQDGDKKGAIAINKAISYDSRGNKSFEEVTFFTKDTIFYQYDNNNKLIFVQKGKDTEKYFYNDAGLLVKKEITRFSISHPLNYTEFYRYAVRQ